MNGIDAFISGAVRSGDRARYLSALLAPRAVRGDLMALYAFDLEILAIPDRVNEPLAGEIRIQWWRDALAAIGEAKHSGNPVADALTRMIGRKKLPDGTVRAYLDAQAHIFRDDRSPDRAALERYFEATHGAVFVMACRILSGGEELLDNRTLAAISATTGYVKLLSEFGKTASRGRVMVPTDMLNSHKCDISPILCGEVSDSVILLLDDVRETARDHLAKTATLVRRMERCFNPAFVHLAVLRSALHAFEQNRQNPFAPPPILNPLMSQWRIWRAARSHRI